MQLFFSDLNSQLSSTDDYFLSFKWESPVFEIYLFIFFFIYFYNWHTVAVASLKAVYQLLIKTKKESIDAKLE